MPTNQKKPKQQRKAKATATKKATTKKATTKKTTTKKTTTKKATSARKTALKPAVQRKAKPSSSQPPVAPPKLKPSAGPAVLKDLGITDAELHAFLPADAPTWVRGVFWCSFEWAGTLDELEAKLSARYTTKFIQNSDPPDPVNGHRILLAWPKGRYVTYSFEGAASPYAEQSPWKLEAGFRESGTPWGSNRAVYERFKSVELTKLKAKNINELTD